MAITSLPKILWRTQNRAIQATITAEGADTETTALSVGTTSTYNRAAGSFIADGFEIDDSVTGSGFTNAGNNVTSTVTAVSAMILTVDATLVVEGAGTNERLVAAVTPDTPLTELTDARRLLWTKFPRKTVNLNIDLGPATPYDITLAALIVQNFSVAGSVQFQSRAAESSNFTTQETLALWTPATSDGADGFGADARPADEYPSDETRLFPDDPLFYALFATAINHQYWRFRIQDNGGDGSIYVSLPALGIPWEPPTNKGMTSYSMAIEDSTQVAESPAGVDILSPGRRRKELQLAFDDADAADTWQEVVYRLEEHGGTDPVFAFLVPPESTAVNIKTDPSSAAGRLLYRSTVYGRMAALPTFTIPAGQGVSLVNVGGIRIRESF